jgi:hypothetical protein
VLATHLRHVIEENFGGRRLPTSDARLQTAEWSSIKLSFSTVVMFGGCTRPFRSSPSLRLLPRFRALAAQLPNILIVFLLYEILFKEVLCMVFQNT